MVKLTLSIARPNACLLGPEFIRIELSTILDVSTGITARSVQNTIVDLWRRAWMHELEHFLKYDGASVYNAHPEETEPATPET